MKRNPASPSKLQPRKAPGFRLDSNVSRLAGLQIGHRPGQHLLDLGEGGAVRDQALLRHPVAEEIVLGRERLGIVIGDPADRRVDRKGDRDHVVERGHEIDVADWCSGNGC